jgi:MoaA/NifB/PqqE/SkfB family radical SAM enzyme
MTCFAGSYLNKDIEKELKIDEIRRISSKLDDLTWLLISGGEPFLREDLDEIIKIFYEQNNARRVTIPTNAMLTKKIEADVTSILNQCPKLKLVISLSIDGVKEDHDNIRGTLNNFKCLEQTYRILVTLKRRFDNLSINMNTCLNNKNISKLDELLNYVQKNFPEIDFHGFELLRGTPQDESFKTPSLAEYEVALKNIKDYWKRLSFYNMSLGRVLKATKVLSRDVELDSLKKGRRLPCFAGSIVGVISATGEVSLCELLPPIGNLRDAEYDLNKVWFNGLAREQRAKIKSLDGICKRCTHSCFVSSAILFNLPSYPRLLWYTLKN